jgi:hypothetical protein
MDVIDGIAAHLILEVIHVVIPDIVPNVLITNIAEQGNHIHKNPTINQNHLTLNL